MEPKVTVVSPHQENEVGVLALALFDFEGERKDMLSFKEGDIITILEMNSNGWWQGSCTNGATGIFPFSYVEMRVKSKESYPFARAVYELPPNAADAEQLAFDKDEVITIIKQLDSNWSLGQRSNGETGRFPFKYVELTGDYNEELFQEEVERWQAIELKKQAEVEKFRGERAAHERVVILKARDEKEQKLLDELAKYKEEVSEWKKKNEIQAKELTEEEEKLKKLKLEMLSKQSEASKKIAEAKAKAAKLRKENIKPKFKHRNGSSFSTNFPGSPNYTAEVLEVDEDPFGDDSAVVKKKKKKLVPMFSTVYTSTAEVVKPELTEKEKNISKLAELEKKKRQSVAPALPPLPPANTALSGNKGRRKVLKKFANLGKGQGCKSCSKSVGIANRVKACGGIYHDTCFRCVTCNKILRNGKYKDRNETPYCQVCYTRGFGPKGFGMGLAGTAKTGGEVSDNKEKPKGEVVKESWV